MKCAKMLKLQQATIRRVRLHGWSAKRWKRAIHTGAVYAAVAGLVLGTLPPLVLAAPFTWSDGDGNQVWTDPNNWSPSGVPGTGDTASFDGTSGAGSTIESAGGQLKILQFLNGANSFNVTGGTFSFDNGSSILNTVGTLGVETVGSNINFGAAGGGSFTLQSDAGYAPTASGGLNITGNISGVALGGSTDTLSLAGAATGMGFISGQISDSPSGGIVAVNQTGLGTWVLNNAANSYSGGTTISGGALVVTNSGALGDPTSTVTVNGSQTTLTSVGGGGTLILAGGQAAGQGITLAQTLNLSGEGNNSFNGITAAPIGVLAGTALTSIGNNTITGNITLGSSSPTGIASGFGNLVLGTSGGSLNTQGQELWIGGNGNIAIGADISGAGSLRVDTYGTVILTGNNASLGNTTNGAIDIDGGNVRVSDPSQLGALLSNNENLYFTGAAATTPALEIRTDVPNNFTSSTGGLATQSGSSETIYVDRAVGGSGLNGQLVFSNNFTLGANNAFTLAGLDGYGLSIGNGTAFNLSGASNPTFTNSSDGTLTINGTIEIGQATTDRALTLAGNGEELIQGSLQTTAGTTGVVATNIASVITKSGSGTVTVTGTTAGKFAAGSVNVNAGTLAIASFPGISTSVVNLSNAKVVGALDYVGSGETSTTMINLAGTTGPSVLLGNQTSAPLTLSGVIATGGVGAKFLYLGGSSSFNSVIQGVIQDSSNGATSVSKVGTGTWVLDPQASFYNTTTGPTGVTTTASAVSTYFLPVSDTTGLFLGETVSGTGLPANEVITGIGTGAIQLSSQIGTKAVALGTALTFGSGVANFTGNVTVEEGTLVVQAATATSNVINDTSAIIFNKDALTGSGTAGGTFVYQGFTTGSTETVGALTVTAGAGAVQLTGGSDGTGGGSNLTFASLAARTAGATLDFEPGTGNISFTTAPTATNGVIIGSTPIAYATINGTDYATLDANNNVVAPTYGATGSFIAGLPVSGSNAAVNYFLAGSGSTTAAESVNTLKLTASTGSNTLALFNGVMTLTERSILFDNSNGAYTIAAGGAASKIDAAVETVIITSGSNPSNALTIGALIGSGAGVLTKSGTGTLVITAANNYTGNTNIEQGTLQLSGPTAAIGAITTAANITTIRQGATLDLNGAGASSTVAIGALVGAGTVTNSGGGSAMASTLQIGLLGTTTAAGVFSGILQDGGGMLNVTTNSTGTEVFSGANTYTGATVINGGILSVTSLANGGVASGIGASTNSASNLVLNGGTLQYSNGGVGSGTATVLSSTQSPSVSTDRLFTLGTGGGTIDSSGTYGNSFLTTVAADNAALVFSNTGAIVTTGATTLTLTGTSIGDNTIAPLVSDFSTGLADTSVTKTGPGTWALTNNNTYSGPTTISGGQLNAVDGVGLPTASNLVIAGGVLESSGSFTRGLGSGAGQVNFGDGTVGGGFSASSSTLSVNIGGTGMTLEWGFTAGFLTSGTPLVLNSPSALSEVQVLNGLNLNTTGQTITVNDNTSTTTDFATILGAIIGGTTPGTTGLTIGGAGTLVLAGANSYTGDTQLSAGATLVVGSIGGTSAVTSATTSSLGASGGASVGALYLGNGTTVAGTLVYTGAGEVSDRPINLNIQETGVPTIDANGSGPLVLTNVINNVAAAANQTLVLGGTSMADNIISSNLANNGTAGALGITKQDGGTWVLSGNNSSMSGAIALNGGELGVGSSTALGTGTVTISNAGIFAYGGDQTISNPVSLTTTDQTQISGTNSLTIAGPLTGKNSTTATGWTILNDLAAGSVVNGVQQSGSAFSFQGFTNASTAKTGTNPLVFAGTGNTFANASTGVIADGASGITTAVTMGGTGTLVFSNANTYSGATTVNSGTLELVGGSTPVQVLAATPVTVNGGGTLGVTGNVGMGGSLTLETGTGPAAGGILNMQDGAINTLTVAGSIAIGDVTGLGITAPQLLYDINSTAALADRISVSGSLTLGASGAQISLLDLNSSTLLPVGTTLTLMSYASGSFSGEFVFAATGTASMPEGTSGENYSLHQTATQLLLVATETGIYFGGAQDNAWNTLVGGTASNWLTAPAGSDAMTIPNSTNDVYLTANSATHLNTVLNQSFEINSLTFTGDGTANTAGSSIGNGTGGPNTLTIDAQAQAYGAGRGLVVLSGSGPDSINVGVNLPVSQSWANNSTSLLTVSGPIVNVAATPVTLTLTGAGPITLSGVISDGSGTNITSVASNNSSFTLGGANPNTFSGGTDLSAGIVTLAGVGALGASSGPLTIEGGDVTLQATVDLSGANAILSPVTLNTDLTLAGSNNIDLTGGMTLLSSQPITNNISGGTLTLGAITNNNSANTTLTMSGTGTTTINGVISDGPTNKTLLTINAPGGVVNLTGASTYTGATTVTAGTLQLSGGAGTAVLGATGLTVATGGTLVISGNVSTGAALAVGNTATTGGGALSLVDNSINTFTVGAGITLGSATSTTPVALGFDINPQGASPAASVDLILAGPAGGSKLAVNASGVTVSLNNIGTGNLPIGATYTLIDYTNTALPAGPINFLSTGTSAMSVGPNETYYLQESLSAVTLTAGGGTYYWSGAQDSGWNTLAGGTASNWLNGPAGTDPQTIPTATSDVFMTANSAANLSTNLNQNFTINSLTFTGDGTANATGLSINSGSGSNLLSINALAGFYAAGTGIVVNSGAGADSITAGVNLGNSQSWTNNASSVLVISGNITNVSGAPVTLTLSGVGGLTLSGVISDQSPADSTALSINSSALVLGGANPNTYTGGTTITAASNVTLAGAGALGDASGAVTFNAATTLQIATDLSGGNAIANPITQNAGLTFTGSDNVTFDSATTWQIEGSRTVTNSLDPSAVLTIASNVTNGGASATLTLTGTGNNLFSGIISDNGAAVTSLTVNMPGGTTTLGNANTFSGKTTVTSGTLVLSGGSGTTVLGPSIVTVSAGATLDVAGNVNIGTSGLGSGLGSLTISAAAASAGTLSLLDGTINTLTLNNNNAATTVDLTLGNATAANAPSNLAFDFNPQATGQLVDEIVMPEKLVVNNSGAVLTLNDIGTGNLPLGSYTLMTYVSAAANLAGDINFASTGTNSMVVGNEVYYLEQTTKALTLVAGNTLYFSGAQDNAWNTLAGGTASNWVIGLAGADAQTIPTANSDVFLTANSASNLNTVLNQSFVINSLTFTGDGTANTAGSSIASGTGTNTLTINAQAQNYAAGTGIMVNSGSGPDSITAKIILGATQTWTNNSSSLLTIGTAGSTAISETAASTLTFAGSGPILIAGNIVSGTGNLAITENSTTGGVTTLSGVNTNAGATKVTAGTLNLSGSSTAAGVTVLGGTAVTVSSGATLGVINNVSMGTTTAGTLNVNDGGILNLQDGSINTLTFKNATATATDLTLGGAAGSGSSLLYEISAQGAGQQADEIVLPNILTMNASGATISLNNIGSGSLPTGSYTLMTFASETGAGVFTFAGGATTLQEYGDTFTLTTNATSLQLNAVANATPASAYWSGTQSSVWSTFGALSTTNWLDGPAGNDPLQLPGATTDVFFTANTAANQATTLGGNFTINSLTFTGTGTSNTAGSSIDGGGVNTLTINAAAGANYAAGTGIVVQSGSGANTISAGVILGASQSWTNNSASLLTVSGNVSELNFGTVLTIGGSGTVALLGNNSYSGGTIINGGIVQINSGNSLGSGPATINSATLEATTSTATGRSFVLGSSSSTIMVDAAVTYAITNTVGSNISGASGTLNASIASGAILALNDAANANSYGGGSILSGGGTVQISTATSLGAASGPATINDATVEATADIATNRNFSLGSATSAINVDATHTYTINGTIGDSGVNVGTLNVNGGSGTTGTLVLSVNNSYSGGTNVFDGTLQVNNGSSPSAANSATGSGAVMVYGSSTLASGSAGGAIGGDVTLNAVGMSAPIVTATGTSTLNFNGPTGLTLPDTNGAAFNFNLSSASNSQIDVLNALQFGSLGGTDVINITGTAAAGTHTYVLMNFGSENVAAGSAPFLLGSTPGDGNTYSLINTGTQEELLVQVPVTTQSLAWNTPAGGTWDTTPANTPWLNTGTSSAANFNNGDNVTLGSAGVAAPGSTTITVSGSVSPGSFTVDHTSGTYILTGSGSIDGNTALNQSGAGGTLYIQTANTFTGGANLSAGTLEIGANTAISGGVISSGPIGTGTLTLGDGTSLLDDGSARTLANALSLSGAIALGSTGSGSLTFDPTGLTTATVVTLTADTTLTVNNTTTINEAINGAHNLSVAGAGTLVLGGNDGYTGTTTLSGNLEITSNGSLGASAALALSGGTLDVVPASGSSISYAGAVSGSGNIFVAAGDTLTLSGSVTATIDATGPGTINVVNNSAGTTNVSGGGTYTTTPGSAGTVNLSGGSSLVFTSGGTDNNPITVASGSTGTVTANSGAVMLGGTITKSGADLIFGGAGSFVINGQITGGSAGTFNSDVFYTTNTTINTAGSYLGSTFISNGATVTSGIDNALPTSTILNLGNADTTTGTFDLAGHAQTVSGLQVVSGSSGANIVTNSNATAASTLTISNFTTGAGSLPTDIYSGQLTGNLSLVKTNNGTLVLSGTSNTYTGSTSVTGGTLQLGADGALPAGTTLTVSGSGSTFDLASFSQQVAGLGDGGVTTGTITNSTGTMSTLTVSNSGSNTFNGTISGANLSMAMVGAGTLSLGGSNTYGGGTSISTGTISVSTDANLGSGGGVALASGGTLAVTGSFASDRNFSIGAGGGSLNVSSGQTFTASGAGTWSSTAGGSLNLSGPGTVQLLAANASGSYGSTSSPLSVNANAGTLTGTASVLGNITINTGAAISPGTSAAAPGTLAFVTGAGAPAGTGTGTLAGGGTFDFNIVNANTSSSVNSIGSAGTNWNLLALNSLTVNATPGSQFNVVLAGAPSNFNPSQSYQWDFITTSGSLDPSIAGDFKLNTSSFGDAFSGVFTIAAGPMSGGGFVAIDYSPSAVPEPGSMVLAGLAAMGMAGLGWRRRRQQAEPDTQP